MDVEARDRGATVLDAAHLLGGAVHTLAHLLKPEAVYVSGKLSEAGEPFLQMVKRGFRDCGSLGNYKPTIDFGDAAGQSERRHIMVQGPATTAVTEEAPQRPHGHWSQSLQGFGFGSWTTACRQRCHQPGPLPGSARPIRTACR
jgi:predicted NBD/HSP70 family sugar kinase